MSSARESYTSVNLKKQHRNTNYRRSFAFIHWSIYYSLWTFWM